jgi:hypothetical protein
MSDWSPSSSASGTGGWSFFGVLIDPRAYGALIYMLLSLATGIFYFTWAVTGIALSFGLFILIIGIPFTLLFIGSVRAIGWVEGRIVQALLGVDMAVDSGGGAQGLTFWGQVKHALTDARTWGTLFYMILQLPLGIAYFTLAVTLGVTSAALIGAGSYELFTGQNLAGRWGGDGHIQIDDYPQLETFLNSTPGLIAAVIVGAIGLLLMLHIARGIGYLHGRIAQALLVRS